MVPARNVPKRPPPPGITLSNTDGAELAVSIIGIIIIKRKSIPKANIFCRRNVRSGKRYTIVIHLSIAINNLDEPNNANIIPIAKIKPASFDN
jgi:hypothetical protein